MRAAKALAGGLKALRQVQGLTQAELAEAAGLHVQYVSQLERAQRSPTMETLDRLAGALNAPVSELFAAGEGARPSSRAADVTQRVKALLSAWPGKDQERLVKILLELRRVVGVPKRRTAPRRK